MAILVSRMRFPLALLTFATAASFLQAADKPADTLADYIKANYTKYEYNIPVRDGKKLFTQVFRPKDTSKTYPFLLNRTPYSVSPYGVDNYPGNSRTLRKVRPRRIHLRTPGCARPLSFRRHVCRNERLTSTCITVLQTSTRAATLMTRSTGY